MDGERECARKEDGQGSFLASISYHMIVEKFEFFNLKKILEKNLPKIQQYFLSSNNL